jgi:hypothetical protein
LDKIEEKAENGWKEQNFSRLNAINGEIAARDDSDYDSLLELSTYSQNPQRERKKEAKKEREKPRLFLHLKFLENWSRQWGPPPSLVKPGAYLSLSYTFVPTSVTDNGMLFKVEVTGPSGKPVESKAAALNVYPPPPEFTEQPKDLVVTASEAATFSVGVKEGAGPLHIQWQKQNPTGSVFSDIPGANGYSYTLDQSSAKHDGTLIKAIVKNPGGAAESRAARLTVEGNNGEPHRKVELG